MVHWTPLIIHMIGVSTRARVPVHFIANAIRGEWNKQPRLHGRSKCPKGKNVVVVSILHVKLIKSQGFYINLKKIFPKPRPTGYLCCGKCVRLEKGFSAHQHHPCTLASRAIGPYLAQSLSGSLNGSGWLLTDLLTRSVCGKTSWS